jgi:hypothetical protein
MRIKTVWQQRNAMVHAIVTAQVDAFVKEQEDTGEFPQRRCLTTGRLFTPRHRWHFFFDAEARKLFYGGQIRPRRGD